MNVVDYVILGIVGISFLFGLYRGFVTSVLGLAAVLAAMFAAYALAPQLSDAICQNETVVQTLIHYTDASSRLGDVELSTRAVAGLDATSIAEIVERANLPAPFDALLQSNLAQQVYASLGSISVSEYLNQTIVTAIVTILCYIVTFLASYLALSLLAGLIGYVFKFPVLKHLDALLGGVFGIARGVFVAYVLFALVPILVTVLPFEEFEALIEASMLGIAMYHSNIVTTILQGGL